MQPVSDFDFDFWFCVGMSISPLFLISNALVAFLLNIAAVFLVSAGSGLVLTLAGVFKDILLITGSVLVFGTPITPLQVVGTSLSCHFV